MEIEVVGDGGDDDDVGNAPTVVELAMLLFVVTSVQARNIRLGVASFRPSPSVFCDWRLATGAPPPPSPPLLT